jgi:hypothetical protein
VFNHIKKAHSIINKNSLHAINLVNKPKPIFIIGMPRSGTTLIEQVISSHSEVMGAGETPYVHQFGNAILNNASSINTNDLLNFRKNYIDKLESLSNGKPMITDKMPQNFLYISLICSTFKNAKIVHVKRNPAATCWGNYKQLFENKKTNNYSYSLNDVVDYFGLYKKLMQFWEEQYSNLIYHLDYEMFTMNQEDETIKLIKYLDLKWENQCLTPQNNKRFINTASNAQIRQKVYQGSSLQWKKFESCLNGIFNDLKN